MNPLLQRWISADPLEVHDASSGEPNVYAYVSGRALKNIDPLGLLDEEAESNLRIDAALANEIAESGPVNEDQFLSEISAESAEEVTISAGSQMTKEQQVERFQYLLKREEFAKQMDERTRRDIGSLALDTQAKVQGFYEDARRLIFEKYPGWEYESNGAPRPYSEEVRRGKNPLAPFMHFSKSAIDIQPVVDGKQVDIRQLASARFDEFNQDMEDIAKAHGLTAGNGFGHPEHFEDRHGMAYTRAIEDKAESGAFGPAPKRDATMTPLTGEK